MRSNHTMMSIELWQQLETLFHATVDLDSNARALYLDRHCSNNHELRQQVERLVAADPHSSARLHQTIGAAADDLLDNSLESGQTLGAYQLTDEIQHGGMGIVYLAERADGSYQQQVAIKVLRHALADENAHQLFLSERQILADLNHPNIAQLIDGGTCEDGSPYLVMEYIDGVPIDLYCRKRSLNLKQRLQLFLSVCHAVAFSHHHNVIHYDIKPANILVTRDGIPKLLDFGIARLTSHIPISDPVTLLHLTPEYASPEQICNDTITPASDVYTLGVLLYELLTGQQPYHIQTENLQALRTLLCDKQASESGSFAQTYRYTEWKRNTNSALGDDLDDILNKSIHRDPEKRYATAGEFSEDLQRYLEHEPVLAHKQTYVYRLRKFTQRHRASVSSGILLGFFVLLSGILIYKHYSQKTLLEEIIATQTAPSIQKKMLSVAVLPFSSSRQDTLPRLLASGITDHLISHLSQVKGLAVIANQSVSPYKQSNVDVAQIAQQLNVSHLVHGKTRLIDGRLIFEINVVDGRTLKIILTRHIDGKLDNIFALQDQVLQQVIDVLPLPTEKQRRRGTVPRHTDSMPAYQAFLQGLAFYGQRFKEANQRAQHQFSTAINLDPNFARAYATLANTYRAEYINGWSDKPDESLQQAERLAQQALELNSEIAQVHFVMALIRREQKRHDEALTFATQAITLNPNYADAFIALASILCYNGKPANTIALIQRAERLNPQYPASYPFHSGACHFTQGNFSEAAGFFEKALIRNPASQRSSLWLAASYALNNRIEEANWKIEELLMWNPDITLSRVINRIPYTKTEDKERLLNGLRLAGLPR